MQQAVSSNLRDSSVAAAPRFSRFVQIFDALRAADVRKNGDGHQTARRSYAGGMEDTETERFVAAMLAAFPGFLESKIADLGVVADDTVTAAVRMAADQLHAELESLLSRPAVEQADSPLELVRRATQPVSAALAALGVAAATRDDWEVDAHPEDRYGLYPASSQELGEEVWRHHLQWGVRKAGSVAGVVPAREPRAALPSVAVFGIPAEQRDSLQAEIERRDFRVLLWRNPAALAAAAAERPVLALVHLAHPAAHEAIRGLAAGNIRVVAVGERVDDLVTPGILALGAGEVVASDRLIARLDRLLPRLV